MSESLFKQKILHNESMSFKLKVMPMLELEIEDLLKKVLFIIILGKAHKN